MHTPLLADVVILLERSAGEPREEFPSPQPRAKKWQRIFAPWFNRYPAVEARLLEREIERHAGEAPVLRIRTPEELGELLGALPAAAKATP